ncbi:two-component sensor histidine kinase [Nocardiopsis terrae]|uniref:histidine kinase n=1 Tax=Nocardiopsis terrae TaxID=372655 RepID=A0ABR9HJV6_9ACTN|nr:sensor histidine kinase [Nocardiopsis terrae]MBE1459283.1 signal transduction histidine kinase [Nocardiopsis terrae]GHC89084.1 two-component sensor histidine kinase [Nocardiopsis terrae]
MDYAELSRGVRRALAPAPGWPTRGALVRDALLWLGVCLLLTAEFFAFAAVGYDVMARALVFAALAGLTIVLTRTYPLLAPCLAVFVTLWGQSFLVLLACVSYLAGRRSSRGWLAVLLFVFLSLVVAVHVLSVREQTPGLWVTAATALVFCTALPWLVGVYRRQHLELGAAGWEHARQLQHEQRLTAEQARLRERSRIAQDMHDSLGHELSLIALRAGALEMSPDLGEDHRQEVADLRATAVSATAHLREIIGVLRADSEPEPAPTAPAGESVAALVERARDSGVRVTLVSEGPFGELPPMVDRAAYRVVQESLTNATKYAPGAPVTVWLNADDARLRVRVTNTAARGRGPVPAVGGGHGLTGLRERVRLVGGSFTVGPHEDGWQVYAAMPLNGGSVTEDEEEGGAGAIDELQRAARRKVRPWTAALIAAPVVVVMLVVGVVYALIAQVLEDTTLPSEDFTAISVGDSEEDLAQVLPPYPSGMSDDQLEDFVSADSDCDHYRSSSGMFDESVVFYQLCFEEGVLTAKEQLESR